jgi:methylated-DNA-[protein]-cysteine S-methyltransferase
MQAELTRYSVPGWGDGELWTRGRVVLAHEFAFKPVSDTGGSPEAYVARYDTSESEGRLEGIAVVEAHPACGHIGVVSAQVSLDTRRCLTPKELAGRFAAFLAGEDVRFDDVELDLDDSTPFQHGVATALRAVPRGEVVSYGELAALAGYPGAARAVGTFCARNRFMLVLPCHRVVGAAGVGGYGSAGIEVKRRLLALEGIVV